MSAARPTVMTDRQRVIGFVLCIATILLAVLDTNIVSAATVPIVSDLDPVHGVDKIPWLIAAYQLAATAALPLYGKLCDVLGTMGRLCLVPMAIGMAAVNAAEFTTPQSLTPLHR